MTTPDPYTSSGLPHGVPPVPHPAPPGLGGAYPPALPYPETPTQLPPEMTQMHVPSTPQVVYGPAPQVPMPPMPQVVNSTHPAPGPVMSPTPGHAPGYPPPYPLSPKTNAAATTSLWLGLSAVFCLGFLTGIPAIIIGLKARKQIAASHGGESGDGMAITGIALGALMTLVSAVGLVVLLITLAGVMGTSSSPAYIY